MHTIIITMRFDAWAGYVNMLLGGTPTLDVKFFLDIILLFLLINEFC